PASRGDPAYRPNRGVPSSAARRSGARGSCDASVCASDMPRSVVPAHRSGKRPLQAAARCATLRVMRILVSNDDGAEAQGLRALAEALLELGEVVVCAPDREQSATSRSISLHRPLRIEQLPAWGPDGQIQRWSVDGTPTDAVYIGLNQVLKGRAPDLVASGINRGPNLANDVHYSGTAAAVEKLDPRGRAYYWIGGDEQAHEHVPGSDCDAVFDRRLISVTPLHLDLTAQELVEELKRWELPGLVRD